MRLLVLFALLFAPLPAQATGMHSCEAVAPEEWLTEQELERLITADGWQVRRMKRDGGCWEVYGTMPDGKRVEAYFHPRTGEVLLINQRGRILFRKDGE